MLYTEKLAEVGATADTVSVNLRNRIKRFEKFKREVEANQAKRTAGTLSTKATTELEEAEATLEMENDSIVQAITKWDKNKEINAKRAAQLQAAKNKNPDTPPPPVFEITEEVKTQLAALHYTPEQIAAMAADDAKNIIEAGTLNPNYQAPPPADTPTAKKTGSGVGMVLGILAFGVLAVFGIRAYNNSRS